MKIKRIDKLTLLFLSANISLYWVGYTAAKQLWIPNLILGVIAMFFVYHIAKALPHPAPQCPDCRMRLAYGFTHLCLPSKEVVDNAKGVAVFGDPE